MTDAAKASPPTASTELAGERRQVTVLFADMAGFTSISEQLGEEGTYNLIRPIYELMAAAVKEHAGSVKDFTGDGIMALFGVPESLEDAPLLACKAGLLIQERLAAAAPAIEAEHGVRPQMRIGINTGPAVVTRIHGESAARTALGDTVNLASRLQALAEPGTVLLSDATYRLVQGLVDASPSAAQSIRGKAEPQQTHRLDAIRQGASRFEAAISRGLTPYVGRERELEALERALAEARTHTRMIDVVAEPGMGKSRLLHEFRMRIGNERAFVLSGSCSSDGQQTPFLPFIDVVRGLFHLRVGETEQNVARKLEFGLSALGLHSPENLGLLLNLLGLRAPDGTLAGLDGVQVGLRTRDLLLHLVEGQCRASHALLLLEDLHWLDRASEELLAAIVGTKAAWPLLIVHTRRPQYAPPWIQQANLTTLVLTPLSPAETTLIAQQRLRSNELPDGLSRLLSERAEGNPLFAEELATDLLERGAVRQTPEGVTYNSAEVAAALPSSLQAVLVARLDRLTPTDRILLQAGAVFGRRFDPELLAAATGADSTDVESRMSFMQQLDVVRRDDRTGEVSFKHILVRDVVYDRLLTDQRSALHLKVAEAIERLVGNRPNEYAEILASHYGRTARRDKAFHYFSAAGRKSLDVYALDAAENHFRAALKVRSRKAHPFWPMRSCSLWRSCS